MNIEQIQQLVLQAKSLHIIANHDQPSITPNVLNMASYAGIIDYHVEELVITVKAGTKITDIQQKLAEKGQTLPFSIPFNDDIDATIGQAYSIGSPELRDAVLGVKIIDGQGQILNFGGQVMKNVAGYDVSRLLVGSKGKLAIICEISLRVLPVAYFSASPSTVPTQNPVLSNIRQDIELGLKHVFDPKGIFI